MIKLHNYVIHEIEKKAKSSEVKLKLSKTLAEVNENTETFVLKIHEAFKDDHTTKNAKFEQTEESVFQNQVLNYIDNHFDSNDFLDFSKKSLVSLEAEMKKEILSSGGYFIFADYSIGNKRYITIALLRKKDGFDAEFINDVFVVKVAQNINLEKLGLASRINLDIYLNRQNDNRQYISLITSGREVSDYFKKWVSAKGVINSDNNTASLIRIIKSLETPKIYARKKEFWNAVYSFITSSANKTVNLFVLAEYFYKDVNKLVDYAEDSGIVIDTEFYYSLAKLKDFIEIKVKTEGIQLTIDIDKISKDDIQVDSGFIIIRSTDLANLVYNAIDEYD